MFIPILTDFSLMDYHFPPSPSLYILWCIQTFPLRFLASLPSALASPLLVYGKLRIRYNYRIPIHFHYLHISVMVKIRVKLQKVHLNIQLPCSLKNPIQFDNKQQIHTIYTINILFKEILEHLGLCFRL